MIFLPIKMAWNISHCISIISILRTCLNSYMQPCTEHCSLGRGYIGRNPTLSIYSPGFSNFSSFLCSVIRYAFWVQGLYKALRLDLNSEKALTVTAQLLAKEFSLPVWPQPSESFSRYAVLLLCVWCSFISWDVELLGKLTVVVKLSPSSALG